MQYAIQCDRLQSMPHGRNIWSTHMALATAIDSEEFEQVCDGSELLDEGESFSDFCCSDPNAGFYKCEAPDGPVYFMQTSGFEFFFTCNGQPPMYFDPAHLAQTHEIDRNGHQACLLLSSNDGRLNGGNGRESAPLNLGDRLEVIEGINSRYRLIQDGVAIAAMKVCGGEITDIYVHHEHRGQGADVQLIGLVEAHIGHLHNALQMVDPLKNSAYGRVDESSFGM